MLPAGCVLTPTHELVSFFVHHTPKDVANAGAALCSGPAPAPGEPPARSSVHTKRSPAAQALRAGEEVRPANAVAEEMRHAEQVLRAAQVRQREVQAAQICVEADQDVGWLYLHSRRSQ